MKIVGMIVATVWEARPLIAALNLTPSVPGQFEAQFPEVQLLLTICGIGQDRAKHAALMMAHKNPSLIISTGYGGALQKGIRAGDLAVDQSQSNADWTHFIKTLAEKQNLKMHGGTFSSAPSLLATGDEKMALGDRTGAIVVEMESRAIRDVCREKNIAFGSIRAVSDAVEQNLSAAARTIGPDGKLTFQFWKTVLTRPDEWGSLLGMQRGTSKANRALVRLFTSYFNHLSANGGDHAKK